MNESAMPSAEEVKSHVFIRMVTVNLRDCTKVASAAETNIMLVNGEGQSVPVVADVYAITNSAVREYVPSKVWHDKAVDSFTMLYYTSAALPPQARPFGAGTTYVIVVPHPTQPDTSIEYSAEVRMLVDQIHTPDGLVHFFMFGSEALSLLVTESEGL